MRPLALAALVVGTAGTGAAGYVIYERLTQVSPPPPAPAESQPARLAERMFVFFFHLSSSTPSEFVAL